MFFEPSSKLFFQRRYSHCKHVKIGENMHNSSIFGLSKELNSENMPLCTSRFLGKKFGKIEDLKL